MRSIPAPAGEPIFPCAKCASIRVYPRACGGTALSRVDSRGHKGLSPRLRGNLRRSSPLWRHQRSIPAPAGEPIASPPPLSVYVVYPRACGGTIYRTGAGSLQRGLSPRLRGNPFHCLMPRRYLRSIPAPAGEPRARRRWHVHGWVYPRACGGTHDPNLALVTVSGLSPRLRGNPIF